MADATPNFACPICLDTLQTPISITACDHNFYQGCLESLCRLTNQANCPTCRRVNAVRMNAITDLTRNFLLEDAVEKMKISAISANTKAVRVLSGDVIIQLTDKAEILISEQQHNEALDILQTIIVQVDGKLLIIALYKEVHILLMIYETRDAVFKSEVMIAMVKKEKLSNAKEMGKCCNDIEPPLIENFARVKNDKTLLSLHHCLIRLIHFHRQGIKKLQEFCNLGHLMPNISKETIKQNLQTEYGKNSAQNAISY